MYSGYKCDVTLRFENLPFFDGNIIIAQPIPAECYRRFLVDNYQSACVLMSPLEAAINSCVNHFHKPKGECLKAVSVIILDKTLSEPNKGNEKSHTMQPKLKIILLSSAFNGLTQRAWAALKEAGHMVSFQLFTDEIEVVRAVERAQPDIVICPFLKDRVPAELWQNDKVPVIIIHPGIIGDRGASALDWTIVNGLKKWGVTALQAVEEMDAGPVWSSHGFDVPHPIRKSELYNSAVSDAAMKCIFDTIISFIKGGKPTPLPEINHVEGRLQPNMKQADRSIDWSQPTLSILQKINASDGVPGIKTIIGDKEYYVYDAHPSNQIGEAGKILGKRFGSILLGTGDKSLWIGSLKPVNEDGRSLFKYPAVQVLGDKLASVPDLDTPLSAEKIDEEYSPVRYTQDGQIGELTFDFYNGAMSTEQCEHAVEALRFAKSQNIKILIVKGGWNAFSNGIHLNTIEAADCPGEEAWRNIQAIDDVCLEILTAQQFVIAGVSGSAGAGGVMLALTADLVLARDGIVLNPHYATMGLYGSEYWTYTLPKRVGAEEAKALTSDCLPVSAAQALNIGLIDGIGPRDKNAYLDWLRSQARAIVSDEKTAVKKVFDATSAQACRTAELAEMRQDLLEDRNQFSARRTCFVMKKRATKTPDRLVAEWAK